MNLDHIPPKIKINCISDGIGTTQFLKVVGEIAQGKKHPQFLQCGIEKFPT